MKELVRYKKNAESHMSKKERKNRSDVMAKHPQAESCRPKYKMYLFWHVHWFDMTLFHPLKRLKNTVVIVNIVNGSIHDMLS